MRQHVDLPTVDALKAEWARHPPVHHLVAAYLNYKPPAHTSAAGVQSVTDIEGLLGEIGQVPIRAERLPDDAAFEAAMALARASATADPTAPE